MSDKPESLESKISFACLLSGWIISLFILGTQCLHWARYGWWQSWPLISFVGDWGARLEWRGVGKVLTWVLEAMPLCAVPAILGHIASSALTPTDKPKEAS